MEGENLAFESFDSNEFGDEENFSNNILGSSEKLFWNISLKTWHDEYIEALFDLKDGKNGCKKRS